MSTSGQRNALTAPSGTTPTGGATIALDGGALVVSSTSSGGTITDPDPVSLTGSGSILAEQAGGRATDGVRDILDVSPNSLHQRTPLIVGGRDEIELLQRTLRET